MKELLFLVDKINICNTPMKRSCRSCRHVFLYMSIHHRYVLIVNSNTDRYTTMAK